LQGVIRILVKLPAERLLYFKRTALPADTAQNCLLLRGKLPDFKTSPLSVIPSFNCDALQKAEGPPSPEV